MRDVPAACSATSGGSKRRVEGGGRPHPSRVGFCPGPRPTVPDTRPQRPARRKRDARPRPHPRSAPSTRRPPSGPTVGTTPGPSPARRPTRASRSGLPRGNSTRARAGVGTLGGLGRLMRPHALPTRCSPLSRCPRPARPAGHTRSGRLRRPPTRSRPRWGMRSRATRVTDVVEDVRRWRVRPVLSPTTFYSPSAGRRDRGRRRRRRRALAGRPPPRRGAGSPSGSRVPSGSTSRPTPCAPGSTGTLAGRRGRRRGPGSSGTGRRRRPTPSCSSTGRRRRPRPDSGGRPDRRAGSSSSPSSGRGTTGSGGTRRRSRASSTR